MAKVGVHFENALVIAFKRPLETHHIGGAKTHLTLAADQVDSGILVGFGLDEVASTIRRTIIHHQDF